MPYPFAVATRRAASLKPQLHLIREWVQAGATDIWIAHKLESTPASIARFRRQHAIAKDAPVVDLDTLIEIEADEAPISMPESSGEPVADEAAPKRRSRRGGRGRTKVDDAEADAEADAAAAITLEGVFDHGEEGYGLWLDGAVRDAAVYRTSWAGAAAITVTVEADVITIRRA